MGGAIWGLVLALAGSAGLSALIWVANCGTAFCERTVYALGLAATSVISATCQALVLVGLWLLWRSRRR